LIAGEEKEGVGWIIRMVVVCYDRGTGTIDIRGTEAQDENEESEGKQG
jgi:hypothetical protein